MSPEKKFKLQNLATDSLNFNLNYMEKWRWYNLIALWPHIKTHERRENFWQKLRSLCALQMTPFQISSDSRISLWELKNRKPLMAFFDAFTQKYTEFLHCNHIVMTIVLIGHHLRSHGMYFCNSISMLTRLRFSTIVY